jgi:hypothetical protein
MYLNDLSAQHVSCSTLRGLGSIHAAHLPDGQRELFYVSREAAGLS